MSFPAIRWAMAQRGLTASQKWTLVAMADNAGDDGMAWPCVADLSEKTGLDRKTVMDACRALELQGFVIDTTRRKGQTKSVKVYQLAMPSSTENGTVEQCQNRDTLEPEAVPFLDGSSTVFGRKQYQKRDTEPIRNLSITNTGTVRAENSSVSGKPEDVLETLLSERPDLAKKLNEEYTEAEQKILGKGDRISYPAKFKMSILQRLIKSHPQPLPAEKTYAPVRVRVDEIDDWLAQEDAEKKRHREELAARPRTPSYFHLWEKETPPVAPPPPASDSVIVEVAA